MQAGGSADGVGVDGRGVCVLAEDGGDPVVPSGGGVVGAGFEGKSEGARVGGAPEGRVDLRGVDLDEIRGWQDIRAHGGEGPGGIRAAGEDAVVGHIRAIGGRRGVVAGAGEEEVDFFPREGWVVINVFQVEAACHPVDDSCGGLGIFIPRGKEGREIGGRGGGIEAVVKGANRNLEPRVDRAARGSICGRIAKTALQDDSRGLGGNR